VGISWEMVINYYGKMAILLGIYQEMVIFLIMGYSISGRYPLGIEDFANWNIAI